MIKLSGKQKIEGKRNIWKSFSKTAGKNSEWCLPV
jgi:hypothetical protein